MVGNNSFNVSNGTQVGSTARFKKRSGGFTLLEVLIALAVGLIAIGAAYSVYDAQLKAHRNRKLSLELQQNLRAALMFVEQEIRIAGFDPEGSGHFGIVDVRRYELEGTGTDDAGQPALFYTVDHDENGELDARNHDRNKEHCSFRIRHDPAIGRRYLSWDNGAGRHPVSETIHQIGFAYGVDADEDGRLDTWNGGTHLVWAVDSDNDNRLDTHLDANGDGVIDPSDDTNGDGRIDPADGGAIDPPLSVDRIRAIRVWLLARSRTPVPGRYDANRLVVGDRISAPVDGRFMRKVIEADVIARNL